MPMWALVLNVPSSANEYGAIFFLVAQKASIAESNRSSHLLEYNEHWHFFLERSAEFKVFIMVDYNKLFITVKGVPE